MDEYDVVIVGAGSGGYSCALRASQLGMSVLLVERDRLGGTCLHQGCIPTKAMLHAAEVADTVRTAADVGVAARLDGMDWSAFSAYRDAVVGRLFRGLEGLVRSSGVTLVSGDAVLAGPRLVEVGGHRYAGKNLVLATGSVAVPLPGVPFEGRLLSSREALQLADLPGSVVVIGGSVIGVEFASAWRSLGVEVTIVESLPGLVPLEEPSLGKSLARAFRDRGIDVRTGVRVASVSQTEREARVLLETGETLSADVALVAIGRTPNTGGLGLEEHGIVLDDRWIRTDDRLRTTAEHVWAVGDLVRGPQLAHRGFAHGIFLAEEIAGLGPAPVVDELIPRVTYAVPEIASVGLTESGARDRYGDVIETVEYSLAGNGKSLILGGAGLVKLVALRGGPILGVHMVGERMGEQVGEAALLVAWEATAGDAALYVHAHPTQNEALGEAALSLAGKPLHSHG